MKIYFSNQGKIQGAQIKNYLLEKSRVVGNTPIERSYHIFFQLLRGLDNTEFAKYLGLVNDDGSRKDYHDFKYISVTNDLDPKDDIENWY